MKRCVLPIMFVVSVALWPRVCSAQVILVGCTANTTPTGPTSKLVDINVTTGAATNPRETGVFLLGGIAFQPSTGVLFGLTTFVSSPANSLVTIDVGTGIVSPVGPTGLVNIVEGDLAFNPIDGLLYGIQYVGPLIDQRSLFQINPSTGTATVIGSIASQGDFSAMSFSPAGTLFVVDTSPVIDSLMTIDPSNATITSSIPLSVNLGGGAGLAFHPTTQQAYLADRNNSTEMLYSLNTGTGVLTAIGPTGIPWGISGLTFITVPEPSSFLLVGGGALAFWRWRRRKVVALAD